MRILYLHQHEKNFINFVKQTKNVDKNANKLKKLNGRMIYRLL